MYLAALLGASGCLCLLDARWHLYFWLAPVRAAAVTAVVTGFLLLWDAAGIAAGIFLHGHSPFTIGLDLAPQLPLEEPVFLAFLAYLVAVLLFGSRRMLDALRERGGARQRPKATW
jgi:lycopene cyclase domain-containing protein